MKVAWLSVSDPQWQFQPKFIFQGTIKFVKFFLKVKKNLQANTVFDQANLYNQINTVQISHIFT